MGNIVKDEKGVYRWVYEFSLWRNPAILITILKIFLAIMVGMGAFLLALRIPDFASGAADAGDMVGILQLTGGMLALMAVLTLVGYALYAVMQGGKYCVVFTMDEHSILHKQLPQQFEKSQVASVLNVIAGLAGGRPGQAGIGIITATHDATRSDFDAVRSIVGSRALCTIKVNEPHAKNQVYVDPEDYDFVFGFIRDHCPNATKVKG